MEGEHRLGFHRPTAVQRDFSPALGKRDHFFGRLDDLGGGEAQRPVHDEPEGPVFAVVEQKDDGAVKVGINQVQVGDEEVPCQGIPG